jgi:tetratricopeptide (TPR) repeat protein
MWLDATAGRPGGGRLGGTVVTLRLMYRQDPAGQAVELTLDGPGGRRRTVSAPLAFDMTVQDREDVRWYLEDYLQYPVDPAPLVAHRVEALLASLGTDLFTGVFGGADASSLWAEVAGKLADTRIEIEEGAEGTSGIPWELLRDPAGASAGAGAGDGAGDVALGASAFVRSPSGAATLAAPPELAAGTLRVLLVICRPAGSADVPFRSVASHLVRLSSGAREAFQLDVLRPPTFEQLRTTLEKAKAAGSPYHVVHFDGHGAYLNADVVTSAAGPEPDAAGLPLLWPPRPGAHGFLFFEDPDARGNQQLADGPTLGALLASTGVQVLVLNACRSAHADLVAEPETVTAEPDAHQRIRAYGSLAQEVVDAGVAGVVAMRYNVYVVTAAQFIGSVYTALRDGRDLGTAVNAARRQLAACPLREVGGEPRALQDWLVPVVYEATPLALPAFDAAGPQSVANLSQAEAERERASLDPAMPAGPEVGFFGRDETLLALDRAFDVAPAVLLQAWAGAGKTATAMEFARWYRLTGAADEVLFTSFAHRLPLDRLLDQVGNALGPALAEHGVQWAALDDAASRRAWALRILDEVPVLWVWDNVEPVTGFPAGASDAWPTADQQELAGFLSDLSQNTRCKVLLTSRRDEHAWLGNLVRRVNMPPMPMLERRELARAIAAQQPGGAELFDSVQDWRPLLEFTQGNPLTVTILVRQALRDHRATSRQIGEFVAELRAGAAKVTDDDTQGRDRSLASSLNYGFSQAFTEDERAQLALLSLFQGFVDVTSLRLLGSEFVSEPVPAVAGLTPRAGRALLDRAAEVGLLTALPGGRYTVHPAVPWHLQGLFARHYGPPGSTAAQAAVRVWTEAASARGRLYFHQFEQGDAGMVGLLSAEEANLLRARQLTIEHRWTAGKGPEDPILGPMQGLCALYDLTGRRTEWRRLVEELVPFVTDPGTGGPLPGGEQRWDLITGYRIRIATRTRDWQAAEKLQETAIAWCRKQAKAPLALPPEELDETQRNLIRNLAVAVHARGDSLREQHDPGCVQPYLEATALCQRIGARREESMAAHNLGRAYEEIPGMRDLDESERWYRRDLELLEDDDTLGRARLQVQLGNLATQRYRDALLARVKSGGFQGPVPILGPELARLANTAIGAYMASLKLLPADATDDFAVTYNQLGLIYRYVGRPGTAFEYIQKSIMFQEQQADRYGAGTARGNAAEALEEAGRYRDALLYARASLRDFLAVGPGAAERADRAREMISRLERGAAR